MISHNCPPSESSGYWRFVRRLGKVKRITLLFALAVIPAFAQNLIFGSLNGTLTDAANAAVAGAKMTLINEATSDIRTAITDAVGVYQFLGLTPGTYRLEAEMAGFKRFV